jgi:hypothetical protein
MAMTKAAKMAMELMRKSMPSKSMNKNDAARVEAAIRKNPKLYKGLTPSEVLDMLPPKGMTGKVVGMPIKGKMTKKSFGGILKAGKKVVDTVKKKINKKDSKGNTISIFGKPSANQTKIKKAQKQQRTTRREKAKSFGKGAGSVIAIGAGAEALKGKKSQLQSEPMSKPTKKPKLNVMKPKPRPKKKTSGVTFGFEVIPKGGKTKKFSGGGKIGGMKVGPATPNRLY